MIRLKGKDVYFKCSRCKEAVLVIYEKPLLDAIELSERVGWKLIRHPRGVQSKLCLICPDCLSLEEDNQNEI